MADLDIEDHPEFIEQCREILHYPPTVEITSADVVRAVELLRAEGDLLDATADVLERSFWRIADEFGAWPGNNPPEGS